MAASIVSAGCDWLSLTATPGERQSEIRAVYLSLATGMLSLGHTAKPFGFQGYRGTSIGTFGFGTRDDGAFFRATGSPAHTALLAMKYVAARCTRLDLQVTMSLGKDDPGFGKRMLVELNKWQKEHSGYGHPHPYLIDGNGKGDTLYVGARESRSFCRVYDKDREQKSKKFTGLWRIEVQFNRDWAPGVFEMLQRSEDETATGQKIVSTWCADRGLSFPVDLGERIALPKPAMPMTDCDRQLKWLKSHVRGTVQKLITAGYGDEVRKALLEEDDNHSQEE